MNIRYSENLDNRIVCISTPFVTHETVMSGGVSQLQITHHLDVLGFYCPVPLHETKKALESLSNGDVIGVTADDPEALHDIPMYLARTEHILKEVVRDSGEYCFIIEVKK
tara:strand:+ start:723 stop:1052 length:330 start_codon:yes stop_codon:yes gene_type:complete